MKRRCIEGTVRTLAVLFWGILILLCWHYRDSITVEGIVNCFPENMIAAAGIMLLLFALKGITVVIFCGILYMASGILFSLPIAITVNIIGTAIMTSVPFFIGKKAGSALLDRLARKNRKLELLRDLPRQNEWLTSFAVRIVGCLPADLVSMYLGASGLKYSRYIGGTIAGMLPSVIAFSVMGTSIHDITSPAFWISVIIEVLLILLSLVIYLFWRKKHLKESKK